MPEPFSPPSSWAKTRVDAAAARAVSEAERPAGQKAQGALDAEWARLRTLRTWEDNRVEKYDDVIARRKGQATHFARLIAILVEKNS